MVRVLGDLSGLSNAFKKGGDAAQSAAAKAHSAFSGMLGMLNQSGVLGPFGEALSTVDEGLTKLAEHGHDVGNTLLGAGGTLLAVGGLFSTLGSKEQAAHQQLSQAISNTGHSYEDYGKQIEGAIKHNEKFGQSSEATQGALQVLTQATNDPAKALQLLNTATDLAAAKHEDLVTAATAVGKVYNGNTKLLKEFGIQVSSTKQLTSQAASATKASQAADDNLARAKRSLADIELVDSQRHKLTLGQQIQLRNAQEAVTTATAKAREAHQHLADTQAAVASATKNHKDAVTELSDRLKGQAAANADTFTGHLKAIKTEVEDQAAKFGQKYGPAITKAGAAMSGLGGIIKLTQAGMEALRGAQAAATVATDAETAAEVGADAAGLPLIVTLGLIALAVAALIVVGYEIYKHWNTIWHFIKNLVMDVWHWIAKYWPYLLGILLGPIALAAVLLWKNWAKIKADAKEVIDYITSIWNGLVSWLTGIPGAIWHALTGMWHFVYDEANTIAGWVEGAWQAMIRWVAGIPGAIASALWGMWNFIYNQFTAVWGLIQSFWGRMWGWIVGLPGAVGRALGHMWDSMAGAFRGAIDSVIRIWNSLHFKIGGWSVGPVHLPTVTIGMPTIPYLAQGGLITREGLIYAHAGEAITPAREVARRGPVVHIEHAHFADTLDVEAFMRKVAWTATAKAM
jgi:hypothetical protein